MTDLTNPYHSHGSTGEEPPNGLDKAGGDQYEASYFDYFADQDNKQTQEKNEAITRRVSHLSGDRILDGLDVTNSSGRTINVGSSTGAYVNGQFTGTIDSRSLTLSSNGSGSTRTDSVYVDSDGNVSTKTGTTTVPSSTYKIAEVDISTNDIITDIRDVGLQRTKHGVASDRPSGTIGNTLYHEGGSPTGREEKGTYEVYDGTEWRELLFADGRQERTDHQYYGGNNIYNVGNIYHNDGSGPSFEDTFVNESGDTMSGNLVMGNNTVRDLKDPSGPQHSVNLRYLQNNYAPDNHLHDDRYVNESGDAMTGNLVMNDNNILGIADPDGPQHAVNRRWAEDRYVNENGDTMTGKLRMDAAIRMLPENNTATSRNLEWENETINKQFYMEYRYDKLEFANQDDDTLLMTIDVNSGDVEIPAGDLYVKGQKVN